MSKIILIVKYALLVIASYILVHIFGIFGIFIAVAYPIWCLISAKKVPCFFCMGKKEGEICPACGVSIKKDERFPKGARSVIFNISAIFLIFLLSLGTVAVEAKVLQAFGFYQAVKTVSFSIPTKGQYQLGEIFPMDITLANVKTPINTVQADLGFDPGLLEVMDITTDGSFAKVFVQKEVQNDTGFARISGGLPSPGVTCDECHFASVIFRTKKPGTAVVDYLPSSLVLANDGKGSNIIKSLGSTAFIILPEKVNNDQLQKQEVYLQTKVLGAKTESTENQMYLFKGKVLAENTLPQVQEKSNIKPSDWLKEMFSGIQRLDAFVIDFWKNVFSVK
jgi:hypothetical protein